MAINVAVFVWTTAKDSNVMGQDDARLDSAAVDIALFRGPFRTGLTEMGGTADGEWYRLITSGFLHFGIFHLAFNMLLLFQLGNLLEPLIGRVRFGLLYLAALLGGSAGVLVLTPNSLTGGASGAVFGLLGAAAVALHQRGVNPLSTGIGTTIMLNLLITFTLPNISIGGHLGGLIAGGAAGWFVATPKRRGQPEWLSYVAPVVIAVAAVAVCYAVGRSA